MELLSERPKSITVLHFGDLQSLKCTTVVAQKWKWGQFRVWDVSLVSDFADKMWLRAESNQSGLVPKSNTRHGAHRTNETAWFRPDVASCRISTA